MRISDWSSDVCSSDLIRPRCAGHLSGYDRRRNDRCPRMERAGCMSIVEIERMRERGIEEGCTRRSMRPFVAEHAVGSFGQAQRLCRGLEVGRHKSELQSLIRNQYAVLRLTHKK